LLAHLLGGVVVPAALDFGRMIANLRKTSNGRWILDGLPNDAIFWDLLAQHDLTPDVVMVLDDKAVSNWRCHTAKFREREQILRHFHRYFKEMVGTPTFAPEPSTSTDSLKEEITLCAIEEVVQQVCEVELIDDDYDSLKLFYKKCDVELLEIDVSLGTWSEVLIHAISKYLNIFQFNPEEVGQPDLNCVVFGSFAGFCPVALNDRNVLLKGQPTLHVRFKNKSYFLSSVDAKQRFMANPQLYLQPVGIPPVRVCITGPPKSGKSSVARRMAEKYGIPVVECEVVHQKGFDEWFKDTVGFVMDGYPNTAEEETHMIKTGFVPELIVNLRTNSKPTITWAGLNGQKIKTKSDVSVDLTWKRVEKSVERHLSRDQLLQTTLKLNVPVANKFIDTGVFTTSRFGCQCPVRNFEKTNNLLCESSKRSEIQAVLFADEIYFVDGHHRVRKFCEDPQRYTRLSNQLIPTIQHRIVVIGSPNSGKTTISRRCAESFGLELINGSDLKPSGGWVLDNPKITDDFLQSLRECGREPTAIVVVTRDGRLEASEELKTLRFKTVKYFDSSLAKWKMWIEVQKFILDTEFGIWKHRQNMFADRPASLKHLNISRQEIADKQSTFQNYCPLCYVEDDKLIRYEYIRGNDGSSILSGHNFHSNLVQWKREIFWTCNNHVVSGL